MFWAVFCSPWHRPPAADDAGGPRTLTAFSGQTMGTTWQVKLAGPALKPDAKAQLQAVIDRELATMIDALSTYEPKSALSRINHSRTTAPQAVPNGFLWTVLRAAIDLGQRSGGAFDITVGPLVNAWGFGPDGRGTPPDAAARQALQQKVGWDKVVFGDDNTVTKRHPEVYLDLSAIAKGYAVDHLAAAMSEHGHHDYMVEIGGEIVAHGRNADRQPWRIGIETPTAGKRAIQTVVPLADLAMATSGDYRNFYEDADGTRRSHTIDPRTGRPITHRLASVTVLHAQCMLADGWATALNVLGPEEGLAVARREQLAAYFIVRQPDGRFVTHTTPAFDALLPGRR